MWTRNMSGQVRDQGKSGGRGQGEEQGMSGRGEAGYEGDILGTWGPNLWRNF